MRQSPFPLRLPCRNRFFLWLSLSILLFSAACGAQPTPTALEPSAAPTAAPTSAPTATPTPLPSATPTVAPTATFAPTATAAPPTPTPTITPTPLPWSDTALSVENAAQIQELFAWGRGSLGAQNTSEFSEPLQPPERVGEDRVLVLSTRGAYLYRESKPGLVAEFPTATGFLPAPDGAHAVLAFPDGTQRLIDLESGETVLALENVVELSLYFCDTCTPDEKIISAQYLHRHSTWTFSQDGQLLATAFNSGVTGVWDLTTGKLLWKLAQDAVGTAHSLLFSLDKKSLISVGRNLYMFKGGHEEFVSRWSMEDGKIAWYKRDSGRLKPELLSPDGSMVGLYYDPNPISKGAVMVYRIQDGTLIGQFGGSVADFPFSPDSKRIAATNARNVEVYQLQPNFARVRTLYTKIDWPRVNFSGAGSFSAAGAEIVLNDGQMVFSAEDYSLVSEGPAPEPTPEPAPIFDTATWFALQHIDPASGMGLQPGPSGPTLSVWGGGQTVWTWDPLSGAVQWTEFSAAPTWAPAFSPDLTLAAACTKDGLELRRFGSDEVKNFGRCLANGVLAFSPGGEVLVQAAGNSFKSLQLADGAVLQNYVGYGGAIAWMEFSPDGALLASGSKNCRQGCTGDLHLWKLDPPGGVSLEPDGTKWAVMDVVFSADQSVMYAAKNAVWKWDAVNGKLLGRVSGEGYKLALSPDETLLAVAAGSGEIRLISTTDFKELARVQVLGQNIQALAFTPDGSGLVSALNDGSLRLWGVPGQ